MPSVCLDGRHFNLKPGLGSFMCVGKRTRKPARKTVYANAQKTTPQLGKYSALIALSHIKQTLRADISSSGVFIGDGTTWKGLYYKSSI